MRALTYALTQESTAESALEQLADARDPAVIEALVELLARSPRAPLALRAIELLAGIESPLATQALIDALGSPAATVRTKAASTLSQLGANRVRYRLLRLLREDESWPVRRAALEALATTGAWEITVAVDDPHWRVRHALVNELLNRGDSEESDILQRLSLFTECRLHARNKGLRAYLSWRWGRAIPDIPEPPPSPGWPFFDSDPFVLTRQLEEMGEEGRRQHLDAMPALLTHDSTRTRTLARQTLARYGQAEHLIAAVARLDDLREGAAEEVSQLMRSIEQDRVEEAARRIFYMSDPLQAQLAWAVDQAEVVFPAEEESDSLRALYVSHPDTLVRLALTRLASRWQTEETLDWLRGCERAIKDGVVGIPELLTETLRSLGARGVNPRVASLLRSGNESLDVAAVRAAVVMNAELPDDLEPFAHDEDASVRIALAQRLQSTTYPILNILNDDLHPLVRAAALTPARAAILVDSPEQETSWHVLHTAARMMKVPAWKLEPRPMWTPPARTASVPEPLSPALGTPPNARCLGPKQVLVPPIGLSGHYGLPVEGFVRAVERGLNFLFWEPSYSTLTAFSSRQSPASRRELHFLVGTFEATPQGCLRDVERALRMLKIEQITLFLVFWVRGWSRIPDGMRTTLERLQREGKIGTFGLSTHNRQLAVEAIESGWNPVMVRHSLAHRGAETEILPHAVARGTSLITFNNTCYGRLLKPRGDVLAPTAADCYRFSLMQPGVTMAMSAPADLRQLQETLQVADDPVLPAERLSWLIEHGAEVYREESMFRRTIRAL